jgi:hypothetical protein
MTLERREASFMLTPLPGAAIFEMAYVVLANVLHLGHLARRNVHLRIAFVALLKAPLMTLL